MRWSVFEADVALRVIARALDFHLHSISDSINVVMQHRDDILASLVQASSSASQITTMDYLQPALAVARRLLGAPEDTKVLLTVGGRDCQVCEK